MLLTATTRRATAAQRIHERHRLPAGAQDDVDHDVRSERVERGPVRGQVTPIAANSLDTGRQVGGVFASMEDRDLVAAGVEGPDDVWSDQSGPANHKNFHPRSQSAWYRPADNGGRGLQ